MSVQPGPVTRGHADAILSLLRGEVPRHDPPAELAEATLERYECGGYLHDQWSRAGRLSSLPPGWAQAISRAHRRTVLDNLAALAEFRRLCTHLAAERTAFILLKGAAYLLDLYPDPGARSLTDVDLLIRRCDAARIARRLRQAGFQGELGAHYPENRRFDMWFPGPAHCRIEFHWSLGLPRRSGVDQEGIWERSRPCVLEGIFCRRLGPEDALLYHAVHAADSYFGPSLKWAIDLREMLRTWTLDLAVILRRTATWRCRTALHLALRHLDKIFPGAAPPDLVARTAPGSLRARLQRLYLASDPVALLSVTAGSRWRYPQRCLMLDRPLDAVVLTLQVLARPASRAILGALGAAAPPWEWSD